MRIFLIEPFYGDSHQQWAEGLKKYSEHDITIFHLSGHHWKWRMHIGAISLFKEVSKHNQPDLIICTDMLDVAVFRGFVANLGWTCRIILYFHENQLTYPWSPDDQDVELKRDRHYAWMNFTSALNSDAVWFNSAYHKASFLSALPQFLKEFPDHQPLVEIKEIEQKSKVMPLGLELDLIPEKQPYTRDFPCILWNHRWEYDKNPDEFFETLFQLKEEGMIFDLIVLGQEFSNCPPIFQEAKNRLSNEITQIGYVSKKDYFTWVGAADILPVTSHQDFFGISIIEAIQSGVFPLLPKRLAYPEHLDEPSCYYESGKLKKVLAELMVSGKFRDMTSIKSQIQKYNWTDLIKRYDQEFNSLAHEN